MKYTVHCIGKDGIQSNVAHGSMLSLVKIKTILWLRHIGVKAKHRDFSAWTPKGGKVLLNDLALVLEAKP